jgi:hypothetical protein
VRSVEYAQLERGYAATSSQLKGYTNSKGWRFDTVRQISVDADGNPVNTDEDVKFVQLDAANKAAKARIKAYKEAHAGFFTPQRRKQGLTPAKLKRAEKTLERVARSQVVLREAYPRLLQGRQYPQAVPNSAPVSTLTQAPSGASLEVKSSRSAPAAPALSRAYSEVVSDRKRTNVLAPVPAGKPTRSVGWGDEPKARIDALATRMSGIETQIASLAETFSQFMAQNANMAPVESPASVVSQVEESDRLSDVQT